MSTMTGDAAAVRIMLGKGTAAQRQARLTKLARDLRAVTEGTVPCPECGNEGPHDTNEDGSEFMCDACHFVFECPEVTL